VDDRAVTYTTHDGRSLTFGAPGGSLHYFDSKFRDMVDWEWDEANGRAVGFGRKRLETVQLKVGIAAESDAEGTALRNELRALAESDVAAGQYGHLSVGEWSMRCMVVGCSTTKWHMGPRWAEVELKLLCERACWVRERLTEYRQVKQSADSGGLDYPHGYPHDYGMDSALPELENPAASACGFLLRVYGPASSPYVQIGDDVHKVDVEVPEGSILTVDCRDRSIVLRGEYGFVQNVFSKRQRGAEGSGTYVFQPVEPGSHEVAASGRFDFDVVLFEEASQPEWN
jgi:hypothetical protein